MFCAEDSLSNYFYFLTFFLKISKFVRLTSKVTSTNCGQWVFKTVKHLIMNKIPCLFHSASRFLSQRMCLFVPKIPTNNKSDCGSELVSWHAKRLEWNKYVHQVSCKSTEDGKTRFHLSLVKEEEILSWKCISSCSDKTEVSSNGNTARCVKRFRL